MTRFVESCVETVAGSAAAVERRERKNPRARRLLRALADKREILVTTHEHPDPDALASSLAICHLLSSKLPNASVCMSIKGQIGGGLNEAFTRNSDLKLLPWNESQLSRFDAIVMLDVQPLFAYSPLPPAVQPTAVIDHHRAPGRRPRCAFCDIRPDVGACSSIVFSYFMELEAPIGPELSATLLFGIESDLAGAAGAPGSLDRIAISNLTLTADPSRLYRMRNVDLPQSYYKAYAAGLASAMYYDNAAMAHIDAVDSLEKPAVIADFLLRFEKVNWALVSGVHGNRLVISLRTSDTRLSAAQMMRSLVRGIGEGGGHRTKAGGVINLKDTSAAEIERCRKILRRRYLRVLKISVSRGQRLVPG
jgi:nanoRNase/pAp phosphatase (c-di-AMP/oligoRNAs hydrolase)